MGLAIYQNAPKFRHMTVTLQQYQKREFTTAQSALPILYVALSRHQKKEP